MADELEEDQTSLDPALEDIPEDEVEEQPESEEPEDSGPYEDDAEEPEETEEVSEVEDEEPAPWYDSDDIALGAGYGLSPEKVRAFEDKAEFNRALRLVEMMQSPPQEKAKEPEPEREEEWTPPLDMEELEDTYGEQDKKVLEAINSIAKENHQLKQQLAGLTSKSEEAERQAFFDRFDSVADTLDEGLLGRTFNDEGQFTQPVGDHLANRQKLFDEYDALSAQMTSRARQAGQPDPPMGLIMKQAFNRAFGQQLAERESKAKAERVAAQSKKRRPANSTQASRSPGKPSDEGDDEVSRIFNSREFQEVLKGRKRGS